MVLSAQNGAKDVGDDPDADGKHAEGDGAEDGDCEWPEKSNEDAEVITRCPWLANWQQPPVLAAAVNRAVG
ncbi:hypothetical protein GCM10022253_28180 [Sphingomonas endophytica]